MAEILGEGLEFELGGNVVMVPSEACPVSSVNGKIGNVVLDAEDVGALPEDTTISEIPNDANYQTKAEVDEALGTALTAKQDKLVAGANIALSGHVIAAHVDESKIAEETADWLSKNLSGATGVVDASLTVSGAAADAKVTGDKLRAMSYAPVDLISGGNRVNKTDSGVTFTWNADKTICQVDGTSSGEIPAAQYFAGSETGFPEGVEPGGTYVVSVNTTTNNASLAFYFYKNGFASSQSFTAPGLLTVPDDAEGMLALIAVKAGATVSQELVGDIGLFRFEPNMQLTRRVDDVNRRMMKSAADGSYPLAFAQSYVNNYAAKSYGASNLYLSTDPLCFDNRFLRMTVDSGYRLVINFADQSGTTRTRSLLSGTHYFYAGKNIPVIFTLAKADGSIISLSDSEHLTVQDVDAEETAPVGGGIVQHPFVCEKDTAIAADYLRYADAASCWASNPIKIPKSGLRIGYTQKAHSTTYISGNTYLYPPYRVMVVKAADNGLALATENEELLAVSQSTLYTQRSVYIPYVENAYVIVVFYAGDAPAADSYDDLFYVSSGEVKGGFCGVYGLFPTPLRIKTDMEGFEGQNALDIVGDEGAAHGYIWPSAMYYGTLLRLREVRRICCSPKYTLLAEIYKCNKDGTITRHSDVYGAWPPDGTATGAHYATSGMCAIDFSDYDFDGFALVAIQSTALFQKSATAPYSVKLTTMGGMARYGDVRDNVYVEYKPGINVGYVPGMHPTIAENIRQFFEWTVPEIGAGRWGDPARSVENTRTYSFPPLYDASVASLYGGTYVGNITPRNVTPKSAMTCAYNRNGRIRKRQRIEDGQPGTSGEHTRAHIGYGTTCNPMSSMLWGLRECYTPWAHVHGYNVKFDRIPFDPKTDLDKLRPGDVLVKYIAQPVVDSATDQHTRTVESIVTVNGEIAAINFAEAWKPFNRLGTYVADDYWKDGNKIIDVYGLHGLTGLDKYTVISRIKPEYINPFYEAFGPFPDPEDITVGTIMCDRGTDSIYGEADNYIELSFKDEDVTDHLTLYKNGVDEVAQVPKSLANEVNGLMLVNVRSYMAGEGLYSVRSDQSNAVQETFYFKANIPAMPVVKSADEVTIAIPNVDDFRYVLVWYGTAETPEADSQRKTPTYIKEQLDIEEGASVGTLTIPRYIDGKEYASINAVYGTPYGTYWCAARGLVSSDMYFPDR